MATITLKRGYYIEIDSLNYTLRQKYIGTTKTGELKEVSRTIGYFGKMEPGRDYHTLTSCPRAGKKSGKEQGIQNFL